MLTRGRVLAAATLVAMGFRRLVPWDGIGDAIRVGQGAVIVRRRSRRLAIGLASFRCRSRRMGVIVHVMGVTALSHILATLVVMLVLDATRSFARGRHVAAVVVCRVGMALGLVRLTALFRAAFSLEAAAASTAAATPTAATCTTLAVALRAAGLARLSWAILLLGDLFVDGLLAHRLRLSGCRDGCGYHRRGGRLVALRRLGL